MENTILTTIPINELKEIFSQILEDKLISILSANTKQENNIKEQYATRNEVAKRLRISLPTLGTLTKSDALKSYRIGRRVLYKWDEVEAVLQEITSTKYNRKSIK